MDKKRIEDFYAEAKSKSTQPQPQSWERVEKLLEQQPKRIIPIRWMWFGAAAAAVAAIIVWNGLDNGHLDESELQKIAQNIEQMVEPDPIELASDSASDAPSQAPKPTSEDIAAHTPVELIEVVEDDLLIADLDSDDEVYEFAEVTVIGYSPPRESKTIGYSVNKQVATRGGRTTGQVFVDGIQVDPTQNESYDRPMERSFESATTSPLSTFSIDVDRAGYSNVRRMINNGYLPNPEAVRAEEMINYFDYQYAGPKGMHPLAMHSEVMTCPWNTEHNLLKLAVQGERLDLNDAPNSNIVFLLDVSGSMESENKLPLLVKSLTLLVNELTEDDRIAIVVYAGSSGLVLPSTSAANKRQIIDALEDLDAGGSTAGGAGLRLAYKVALENYIEDGNNRIILATDGDFNVGESSDQAMEDLIVAHRDKGVEISVLGFGMGNYKDSKMEIIANKGNGNYAYIDNILEAKKTLVKEFGGTLFTIAKDVKIQVEFNPAHVKEYRLIGYETRALANRDFTDDKKDAGEIGSGHTVTALYEIIPSDGEQEGTELKYSDPNLNDNARNSGEIATMKVRYKKPKGSVSKEIQLAIPNDVKPVSQASVDTRFAAAVAEFALLLMNSEHQGHASFQQVLELAKSSKGADAEGYRAEFIRLVETAELIGK